MLNTLGAVLMRIAFFCILTPLALLMRLFGYDPLKLQPNLAASQWSNRKTSKFDKKFFHHQG